MSGRCVVRKWSEVRFIEPEYGPSIDESSSESSIDESAMLFSSISIMVFNIFASITLLFFIFVPSDVVNERNLFEYQNLIFKI